MTPPRLIAIAGSHQGQVIVLDKETLSIGRGPSNRLVINDPLLSRRHCRISVEFGEIELADLSSLNGTFVNGVPVKKRRLVHGDRIRLGNSIFIFLAHEDESPLPSGGVELSEELHLPDKTVMLSLDEALYLDAARLRKALPEELRIAHDLNALLGMSAAINETGSVAKLERRLLEMLGAALPVQQSALLYAGDSGLDLTGVCGWDRELGELGAVVVSGAIAQRVYDEGVAILSNDTPGSHTGSLRSSGIRSLMAVPLTVMDRRLGVLWLSTSDPVVRFDEGHLQLVTAAAAMAAVALDNLSRIESLEGENRRLQEEISLSHNMIGESPRMKEIYQRIARIAPADSTVLIRGESGTGKELAARAIHQNSSRADKSFVAINCAALTETLLESELFGHEKGAFTGAIAQKKGKLEIAHGGTLFLDEMGEMDPTMQAKLLRVLQENEFERVGGTRTIKADIRLIAATNRDLEAAMSDGSFRQDLYYRLNVITLHMPALRERREDIPLLATYFASKYGEKCKRRIIGISAEARTALSAYDWPGNVRELENAIERAVVLGSGDMIRLEDLPEALLESETSGNAPGARYHEAIREAKKKLILEAFSQAGENYTEAARLLGVHPNYLHRLIRNLDLKSALKG